MAASDLTVVESLLRRFPEVDGLDVPLEELAEIAALVQGASHAEQTKRRYHGLWDRSFLPFCRRHQLSPLPATVGTVLAFLAWYGRDHRTPSVRTARCAIRYYHAREGHPDPTLDVSLRAFLAGHARLTGMPPNQKMPLLIEDVRRLCDVLDKEGGVAGMRDKAAILTGFAGALRASEAVDALIKHLQLSHKGMTLVIPRSKTDQEGKGLFAAIVRTTNPATDPVVAMEEWLEVLRARGRTAGPLFPALRTGGDAATGEAVITDRRLTTGAYRAMLKRRASAIGLDPALIGGHSLRAGHATQAAENGADPVVIAQTCRWSTMAMVLRYVRSGRRFQMSSSARLGL